MAFVRLPLVIAGSLIAIFSYRLAGEPAGNPAGLAAGLAWSTVTLTAVNLICLLLLRWRCRVEGISLRQIMGFRRQGWTTDLGIGLLWSIVLGALLMIGITGVVLALHPAQGFAAFEHCFTGDADFSFDLPVWLAVVSATVFPVLNAPMEELQYRGYSQPGLIAASKSPRIGIVVTAIGFGLQHVVFSLTVTAAVAYVVGFFLWGLGAGVIARRQQRLAPLIIAHFFSNLFFGIIPLIFVLQS